MRIISNFKDYYDSVQIYGTDPTKHYVRESATYNESSMEYNIIVQYIHKLTNNKFYISQLHNKCNSKYKIDKNCFGYNHIILFFCGKIFPLCLYSVSNNITIVKNINELSDLILKHGNKELINKWLKIKNYVFYFTSMKEEYTEFFNLKENKQIVNVFNTLNSPCFCIDILNKCIINNPSLKHLEFYTIKDAFTTYQEIAMYMDNFLTGGKKNIVEVSNQVKIDKHGYDKWSFRKEPIN